MDVDRDGIGPIATETGGAGLLALLAGVSQPDDAVEGLRRASRGACRNDRLSAAGRRDNEASLAWQ
jgi:hypothetical protein